MKNFKRMFVSIVLNTEYMDTASRKMWYLKNLLHCKENGWILITHEYFHTHFEEMQASISSRLFNDFEMRQFTMDEVNGVEQYYISDKIFEKLEDEAGSRTEMLFRLSQEGSVLIESQLQEIFDKICRRHPSETIEGVFHCLESWQCVRNVCKKNDLKLLLYSFSAIRKPHGYRQTLYHVNFNGYLHTTEECKCRYEMFVKKSQSIDLPIFSNRELIAIFGKERSLPLIPLIKKEPKYEMGICTECFSIIPQFFIHNRFTDDDIRYSCEKIFDKSQITVRNHAAQMDYMQIDRTTVHNDPAAWILSCKRLASSRSQIMLKALLWNRTAIVIPDTLGFSFMCEKDYRSTKKVDIKALNYYLLGYLIPNDLMFSHEYWLWRMSNPSEVEIYLRHLDFYIKKLNIRKDLLDTSDEADRFRQILYDRHCDEELINILVEDNQSYDVDYSTAVSRFVINGRSHWRLNHKISVNRRLCVIEIPENFESFEFYPLDDIAGCSRIISILVNDSYIDTSMYNDYTYMSKIDGHYKIFINDLNKNKLIKITWENISIQDYLSGKIS